MAYLIDKDALVAEIEKRRNKNARNKLNLAASFEDNYLLSFINTLEVIDPYEQCIQYASIKAGIQAHAETYSFNIESELFNQLSPEQQELWRKEIEQACISGGYAGVELARDTRYKENIEMKKVDLEKECSQYFEGWTVQDDLGLTKPDGWWCIVKDLYDIAKHFFELGLKAKQG